MNALKVGIFEQDNEYYTPLSDNLALMKERNELMRENIQLKKQISELEKMTGGIKDLKTIVGYRDLGTVRNKLLVPFKKELDCSVSKSGSVVYPDKQGKPYKVNLIKFKEWYINNFNRVHKEV